MELINNRRTPLILAIMLGLAVGTTGCNKQDGASEEGKVVATVNGEVITEGELEAYSQSRPGPAAGMDKETLLDELVTQKVVYQEALKQKLDKEPEVANELKLVRTRVLASAVVRQNMDNLSITDEELSAEYDKLKERMVNPEYKASHILVKDEALAKKIIDQLNQGGDFAKLAKEHSTDSSGQSGGDLGWFNPQQMVPPFSQAVAKLNKGDYTKEPVKTQFGWHVIKLEDSRQSEPPALEQLKGRLEQMLKQRKVRDYIQELKDKAKISIEGKEDVAATEESKDSTEDKSDTSSEKKADAPVEGSAEPSEDEKAETSTEQKDGEENTK